MVDQPILARWCGLSVHGSRAAALPHATAIAFLVAFGELAIGLALVSGICVRTASAFGLVYMLSLLFSANYPSAHVPLWQYFGASSDHSVLALCFLTFISGRSNEAFSIKKHLLKRHPRQTQIGSWIGLMIPEPSRLTCIATLENRRLGIGAQGHCACNNSSSGVVVLKMCSYDLLGFHVPFDPIN